MGLSTYSIVAADLEAGEIGVAVQSRFIAVGAVVPWVSAEAGAVATQAFANTSYGPRGLELLAAGMPPERVIAELTQDDDLREDRQVGIVALNGLSATYTGLQCLDWAGGRAGPGYSAQGNILAGPDVVAALASTFESSSGLLADRLVAALRAAQKAGGDRRGQQSAALYIAKREGGYAGFNDRFVDLRVDDHPEPIEELARLLELHKLYFFAAAPEDVLTIDAVLGTEITSLLERTGDLAPGEAMRTALVRFMHRENLENRVREDGTVDRQTVEYLRSVVAGEHV